MAALVKIQVAIEAGQGARTAPLSSDEAAAVKGLGLLTLKPLVYAANVVEDDLASQGADNRHVQVRVCINCTSCTCMVLGEEMGGV